MIRIFARFWAKQKCIYIEEFKAELRELNARLSLQRAYEATRDADTMGGRIKEVEAEDALKISMTGQEEYEARKEREDAEAMVKNHLENAKNSLDTAQAFRKQATAGAEMLPTN